MHKSLKNVVATIALAGAVVLPMTASAGLVPSERAKPAPTTVKPAPAVSWYIELAKALGLVLSE